MGVRALTEEELKQIKTAKEAANNQLKNMRASLRKNRNVLSRTERGNLENRIAALENVTGKPILLAVDGVKIYMDYEILKAFTKSLDRQNYSYTYQVREIFPAVLTIRYQPRFGSGSHGVVELKELPDSKRGLLQGLPEIELID